MISAKSRLVLGIVTAMAVFCASAADNETIKSTPSDLVVEQGSVVILDGKDASVGGLAGEGTIMNGGKSPATLTITGGKAAGANEFSGTITDGPDGAPLSVRKTGPAIRSFSSPPSTAGATPTE